MLRFYSQLERFTSNKYVLRNSTKTYINIRAAVVATILAAIIFKFVETFFSARVQNKFIRLKNKIYIHQPNHHTNTLGEDFQIQHFWKPQGLIKTKIYLTPSIRIE